MHPTIYGILILFHFLLFYRSCSVSWTREIKHYVSMFDYFVRAFLKKIIIWKKKKRKKTWTQTSVGRILTFIIKISNHFNATIQVLKKNSMTQKAYEKIYHAFYTEKKNHCSRCWCSFACKHIFFDNITKNYCKVESMGIVQTGE